MALARDPLNASVHYALATALIQKWEADEAEKLMARYQELKVPGRGRKRQVPRSHLKGSRTRRLKDG